MKEEGNSTENYYMSVVNMGLKNIIYFSQEKIKTPNFKSKKYEFLQTLSGITRLIYLYPYKIQIFCPDISNYIKYKFHFNFKEMQNLIKIGGDKIKLGNIFQKIIFIN